MGPRGFTVTLPPDDDFYFVKREQLHELEAGGRTISLEIALLLGGVVLGYLPSAIETMEFYVDKGTLTLWQIVFASVFIVFAALCVAKFLEHRKSKKRVDTLVTTIKAGQKVTVSPETRST